MLFWLSLIFLFLISLYLCSSTRRQKILNKPLNDWILDLTSLSIQGTLIPLLQTFVFAYFLRSLFPHLAGSVQIHAIFAFCLNFVVVDYLYYWNHRLLHSNFFWPFHRVHHSVTQFDIFATSRNSVYSSFLILYVWVNSFALFLLANPGPYVFAIALTAGLDLWRHAELETPSRKIESFLSKYLFIITPADHATHHDRKANANFGANLNIFDKLHGTYRWPNTQVWSQLGIFSDLSLSRALFFPFEKKNKAQAEGEG